MNKQIEEMAKIIVTGCSEGCCEECKHSEGVLYPDCVPQFTAEAIYTAGYRKPEWISVDERLPDRNGGYLTHCNVEGQSLVCILYFCKVGGFNEGTVTHWMPLPEAPKGDEVE